MGVTVEKVDFKFLDIADRKHPERSGRYIPLRTLVYLVDALRLEADGMDQLRDMLHGLMKDS